MGDTGGVQGDGNQPGGGNQESSPNQPGGGGQPGMTQPGMGQPGMGPDVVGPPGMDQPGMGPPGVEQPGDPMADMPPPPPDPERENMRVDTASVLESCLEYAETASQRSACASSARPQIQEFERERQPVFERNGNQPGVATEGPVSYTHLTLPTKRIV